MLTNAGLLIQVVSFAVIVAAAAVWLKSTLVKQRHKELEQLADTRGKRIEDLESKLGELRREVSELRGEVSAIQRLKAEEIADAVVAKLAQT